MCRSCFPPPVRGTVALSRRSFHQGLLAAAVLPGVAPACLSAPPQAVQEPAISLLVPPGAPRTVALTLDACMGAVDQRIIGALIGLGVPATIFATALWLHANPATVDLLRARRDLFAVQNHGERHLPPVLGTRRVYGLEVAGTTEAVQREVTRGADAVQAALGQRPTWYRGAAGLYSPATFPVILATDSRIAGYSLNADQGASLPAPAVARRIAASRSGDVIVAHVNQPHRASGAGVAAGIAALHAAGVVFVTLDALPTTQATCAPRHPPSA
jgi:peptidoglycan/xylan/chitin deacetylase (PgdA/CDA1 family)